MRHAFLVLAASIGAILSNSAFAEDDLRGGYKTFVHFGSSYVKQADVATLFVLGTPVPGAGFSTEGDLTMSFEAGVFLRGGWAIAASGTVPTTISNIAAGSLTGLGNLGDESVGYYSATGQYHFNMRGPISPYVGAGVGYMHVFTTDRRRRHRSRHRVGLGSGRSGRHGLPPQRAGRPLRRREAVLDLDTGQRHPRSERHHRGGDGEPLGAHDRLGIRF